jgi:preprotein translocase subunit SecE
MINPVTYLQEVNQEMKRITWPSRQKTINMTALVIGVSTIIALFIAGADFVFKNLLALIIG